jgi:hypothetical protein
MAGDDSLLFSLMVHHNQKDWIFIQHSHCHPHLHPHPQLSKQNIKKSKFVSFDQHQLVLLRISNSI